MKKTGQLEQHYRILQEFVRKELSYAAHDYDHIMRVYHLSLLLAEEEETVDLDVLIPAVLLHDIARNQEDEDKTGAIDHAVLGAGMAEGILQNLEYDQEIIRKVVDCIRAHRFRSGFSPQTIEARILFDADKLDVIGAVGIARSFMLAGQHGERIYQEVPMAEYLQENVGPNGRIKDASKHTANLEFELKLKKIPERLFTPKAREIARDRIAYMEAFFGTLEKEIHGKK